MSPTFSRTHVWHWIQQERPHILRGVRTSRGLIVEAGKLISEIVRQPERAAELAKAIHDVENAGDIITHETIARAAPDVDHAARSRGHPLADHRARRRARLHRGRRPSASRCTRSTSSPSVVELADVAGSGGRGDRQGGHDSCRSVKQPEADARPVHRDQPARERRRPDLPPRRWRAVQRADTTRSTS